MSLLTEDVLDGHFAAEHATDRVVLKTLVVAELRSDLPNALRLPTPFVSHFGFALELRPAPGKECTCFQRRDRLCLLLSVFLEGEGIVAATFTSFARGFGPDWGSGVLKKAKLAGLA